MLKLAYFFFFPLKRNISNKIIFSASIDFLKEWNESKTEKFQENSSTFSNNDVEKIVRKVLEKEIQQEIYDITGYKVKVKINTVYYSSIHVIFTVFAVLYGIFDRISRYKNFIESCQLIKNQINRILQNRLDHEFGKGNLKSQVNIEFPVPNLSSSPIYIPLRDGFFYFLFFGFIFLSSVLSILVYHSFNQTYFNAPNTNKPAINNPLLPITKESITKEKIDWDTLQHSNQTIRKKPITKEKPTGIIEQYATHLKLTDHKVNGINIKFHQFKLN